MNADGDGVFVSAGDGDSLVSVPEAPPRVGALQARVLAPQWRRWGRRDVALRRFRRWRNSGAACAWFWPCRHPRGLSAEQAKPAEPYATFSRTAKEPRKADPFSPFTPRVDTRTDLSETEGVKGAEFERRVRKLARSRNVPCRFVASKGKGSHGRLYLGDEFTTLKDRRKEIGRDLLVRMCADLKIDPHDLQESNVYPC